MLRRSRCLAVGRCGPDHGDPLQRHAPLALWLAARDDGAGQVVIAASGQWSQEVTVGTRLPWLGELGLQLVAGRLPDVAPRADGVPARSALSKPWHRVCGYVAVPILAGDGVLCGFSVRPGVTALDRWARQVRLFAELLATVVTAERQADSVREALDQASELAEVDVLTGCATGGGGVPASRGRASAAPGTTSWPASSRSTSTSSRQSTTWAATPPATTCYNAWLGSWSTSAGPATSWRAPAGDEFAVLVVEADAAALRAVTARCTPSSGVRTRRMSATGRQRTPSRTSRSGSTAR